MLPTPWCEAPGLEVWEVWEVWEGVVAGRRGFRVLSLRTLAVPYTGPARAHAAVLGMSSALALTASHLTVVADVCSAIADVSC